MDERIDDIGFGNLKLIQKPDEFCYGIDAVMLADFAVKMAKRGEKVEKIVDLGTGTGIIPLILSHKTGAKEILGVEVQRDSYLRAERGRGLNNLQDRLSFVNLDVKDIEMLGNDSGESYDLVTTNPPYTEGGKGIMNGSDAKTIARHETTANLEDFIKAAAWLLKDKGDFVMVHRPSRLVDICNYCRQYKLEPKEIQMVSPRIGEIPNIMLIHCVKNGGRFLKLLKPLHVYEGNNYSKEIINMY